MSLTNQAVNELGVEGTTLALVVEWLKLWFDGATHAVGANEPVGFPLAMLGCQQTDLPQPLPAVHIQVVMDTFGNGVRRWKSVDGERQEWKRSAVSLMFFVRAAGPETAAGNAKKRVQDAAGLLKGLLENTAATRDLAGKGIHHLRPSEARLVSDGPGSVGKQVEYAMRMVACRADIRYAVRSQVRGQIG